MIKRSRKNSGNLLTAVGWFDSALVNTGLFAADLPIPPAGAVGSFSATSAETAAITHVQSASLTATATVAETTAITDSQSASLTATATVAESSAITDSQSASVSGGNFNV